MPISRATWMASRQVSDAPCETAGVMPVQMEPIRTFEDGLPIECAGFQRGKA